MSSRYTTGIADDDLSIARNYMMYKLSTFLNDNALVRLITRSKKDQYKPEKYYMRGPGPKAKAKSHGGSGDVSRTSNEKRTAQK